MSFLQILWLLSLGLSALALMTMLVLILRRQILQQRHLKRERIRKQLLRDILSYQEGELSTKELQQHARENLPVLAELVSDLVQLVRGEELDRLITLFEELGLTERLIHNLKRRSKHQRLLAAMNLRYTHNSQAQEALQRALDDPDPDVRLAAATSLARLEAAPSLPLLNEKLRIGQPERSQTLLQIYQKLAETRSEEMRALLQAEETEDFTRTLILAALGKSGQYRAVTEIMHALESNSFEVRAAGLRALADLQHPAASQAVLNALSDDAWEVRTQAATCAGRLGLKEAGPQLAELLDDANWWTRYRAAQALYDLGETGREPLSRAANSGRERASRISSMVLAERAVA